MYGEDLRWRDRAACLDEDPELFFPAGDDGPLNQAQIEEAKAVCRGCDVQDSCLSWAFVMDERYGVWGGLSERERQELKRRKLKNAGRAVVQNTRSR